jgi:hypothetical protein
MHSGAQVGDATGECGRAGENGSPCAHTAGEEGKQDDGEDFRRDGQSEAD